MIINNIKYINIGTKDKLFYVPEMTEEMKQWYRDNKELIIHSYKKK